MLFYKPFYHVQVVFFDVKNHITSILWIIFNTDKVYFTNQAIVYFIKQDNIRLKLKSGIRTLCFIYIPIYIHLGTVEYKQIYSIDSIDQFRNLYTILRSETCILNELCE